MTFSTICRTFVGVTFVAIFSMAHALDLNDPIPVGPQVKKATLENGLTYYVQRNTKPERRTELRLVVKAGSVLEDEDQRGLAHVLEHLAFNGSTNFKKNELIAYLQSLGLKFGADLNAYTSFNETVYILPLPTTDPEKIAMGMQVLEDWAHGLTLNTKDIDAERAIVLEELRLGKGVQERTTKQIFPKLYKGSKYADRLPIGDEKTLHTFDPNALRRFYKDWYRPNLMAVVAVGDFDPVAMEKLIKAHFSSLKNPVPERVRPIIDIPKNTKNESLVVLDSENNTEMVQISYPVVDSKESIRLTDYRNDVVEMLFNAMLETRIQELTQQNNPPFIAAAAQQSVSLPGYRSFSMRVALNREGMTPALNSLIQETEQTRVLGFNEQELVRAKKNYLIRLQQVNEEKTKTESNLYAEEYIRNFLVNESIPGIEEELRINTELLPTITIAEINKFASNTIPNIKTPSLLVYTGSSANKDAPSKQALTEKVRLAFENAKPDNTRGEASILPLMSAQPVPGKIIARLKNEKLNVETLTLSNGLRVLLKPTVLKDSQLLLSASRFGGQSLYSEKDKFNAAYATTVAGAMGLGVHTPSQLSKVLAGELAQVHVQIGVYNESIAGSASPNDAETMFQLLNLRFSPARKDEELFHAFISQAQDATKNAKARPETEFFDMLTTEMFAAHPRLVLTPKPEDFEKLSMLRAIDIYNERFSSAKGFDFILVGNIKADKIEPLIEKYLASLPTPTISLAFQDLGIPIPKKAMDLTLQKGKEPKSLVTMSFVGKAVASDIEQVRLNVLTEILNVRIMEVLREQKTLIYSGSAGGALANIPYGQYFIRISLPCAPENVPAVLAAMEEEIKNLQINGPSNSVMQKVMMNWLSVNAKQVQDNDYWLNQLQNRTLYSKPIESILEWPQIALKLTPRDVQNAAIKYMPLNQYTRAVLSPAEVKNTQAVNSSVQSNTPALANVQ